MAIIGSLSIADINALSGSRLRRHNICTAKFGASLEPDGLTERRFDATAIAADASARHAPDDRVESTLEAVAAPEALHLDEARRAPLAPVAIRRREQDPAGDLAEPVLESFTDDELAPVARSFLVTARCRPLSPVERESLRVLVVR